MSQNVSEASQAFVAANLKRDGVIPGWTMPKVGALWKFRPRPSAEAKAVKARMSPECMVVVMVEEKDC